MPTTRLELTIARPARDVYAAAVAARIHEWLPGARSARHAGSGAIEVTFGDGDRLWSVLTEEVPGERLSRRWTHSNGLWGTTRWALSPLPGGGTRLQADLFWVLPERMGDAADALTRGLLERHFANEVEHFRVWAETRGYVRPIPRAA